MSRLIKYALTFLLWRNYKVLIVTTLLLIFTVVIINMAHSDYLTWAQMQEPVVATGMSFIYKYCAYVALLVGFLVINHYANKRLEAEEAEQKGKGNAVLDKILKAKEKVTTKTKASFTQAQTAQKAKTAAKAQVQKETNRSDVQPGAPDPFANIRNKSKLRTQAEIIIDHKAAQKAPKNDKPQK